MFIADEADTLFDMGFFEDVSSILKQCTHPTLNKAYFSATMQPAIEEVLKAEMADPIKLTVGIKNAANVQIEQKLIYCGKEDGKRYAMKNLIREGFVPPMLIFVQNKHRAIELHKELVYEGIKVDSIHGGKPKETRDEIVMNFRKEQI